MSWFWMIPVALFTLAVLTAIVIVLRKLPQLGMMDTSTMVGAREKRVKEAIILERFDRLRQEKLSGISGAAVATVRGASKVGRQAVQRLYALEQYYQKLKKMPGTSKADPETVKALLEQAEIFVKEGEFIQGEKRYIEVISHNPKLAEAYEGLGNLYLKAKQYGQAREVLRFALRLVPEDASVHMSLADTDIAEGKLNDALAHLRVCIEKRPNNPKYLDVYIETALSAKEAEDAKKGIAALKEANPENQKIADFEERLATLTKPAELATPETPVEAAESTEETPKDEPSQAA